MKKIFFLLASVLFFMYVAAQQKAPAPAQKPKYFPLKKGNEWTYSSTVYAPYSDGNPKKKYPAVNPGSFYYHITDTLIVDKKKYYIVRDKDSNLIQIIRFDKATGFYYSRILLSSEKKYSPEKLFLKNNLKLNTSWNVGKDPGKINFIVISFAKDTMINTISYKNVVEIHEHIPDNKLHKIITIKHWYAENIGEVATYISYPASNTIGDLKLMLSDYPTAK